MAGWRGGGRVLNWSARLNSVVQQRSQECGLNLVKQTATETLKEPCLSHSSVSLNEERVVETWLSLQVLFEARAGVKR